MGDGGGTGGHIPPQIFKGGHNIKCPPPPIPNLGLHTWGCMIIHWNEDSFFMLAPARAVWTFFVVVAFLLVNVIEVGDVRGYPYPVFGKLTPKFWRRKKKCRSPPLISFFRTFKAGGGLIKENCASVPPPMVWFGLTLMPSGSRAVVADIHVGIDWYLHVLFNKVTVLINNHDFDKPTVCNSNWASYMKTAEWSCWFEQSATPITCTCTQVSDVKLQL